MNLIDLSGITQRPKVQKHEFLGVLWGGIAIVIICCCFRIIARVRNFKTLLVDDYFVVFALILAIATAIIWQIFIPDLYYVFGVAAGLESPGLDFPSVSERYFRATTAVLIFYYSSLWSIKISFLLFFRRLSTKLRHQEFLWWPVFGFTIATYFVSIGSIQYSCLVRSFKYHAANCDTSAATSFQQLTLKLNCAWDVTTNFLIMLIPVILLWEVRLKRSRKFALAGVFILVIVSMIFAIVRTTAVSADNARLPDSSWLYMWSTTETCVAIIIACLASFRHLFCNETPRYCPKRFEPTSSSGLFLGGNNPRKKVKHLIHTLAFNSNYTHSQSSYQVQVDGGNGRSTGEHGHDLHDSPQLPNVVHVRRDVDLVHESAQV